jgi:hypothetical protein
MTCETPMQTVMLALTATRETMYSSNATCDADKQISHRLFYVLRSHLSFVHEAWLHNCNLSSSTLLCGVSSATVTPLLI